MEVTHKFRFSIVMAVYNVESYLEEAIESVITQDIGFEEHVQLILVDDGSTDFSGSICKNYANLYPNNIVYISKPNGGVSTARNKGMEYVEGKYMNFLDSDDKLTKDTLSHVWNFFEKHEKYVNVVAIPIYFFEGKTGAHILNYRFESTRMINLTREHNKIALSSSSAFVKSSLKDKFKFNVNLKYAEDAEFINKILLETETLGVVKQARYCYRSRLVGGSALQTSTSRKGWYIDSLKLFSLELIRYSIEKKGYVPKFIQYTLMYDLQWRFNLKEVKSSVLDEVEYKEFMRLLKKVVGYIDDDIILAQKHMGIAQKISVLKMKHDHLEDQIKYTYFPDKIEINFNEKLIFSVQNEPLKVEFMTVEEDKVFVEGLIGNSMLGLEYEVIVEIGETRVIASKYTRSISNIKSLGNTIREIETFKAEVPIDKGLKEQSMRIYLKVGDSEIRPKIQIGKFIPMCTALANTYFTTKQYSVVFKYNSFIFIRNNLKVKLGREYRVIKELIKKKKLKIAGARLGVRFLKAVYKKPVWLFMDRIDKADDNAEHLFKYAMQQKDGYKKYFVISKESPDFERMQQYGPVIEFNSKKHKLLLLLARHVISSHGEDSIRVPFGGKGVFLRDLVNFKFTFLQHGIIKDDLSEWLNKYNKNIDLFVTTVYKEYESIIEGNYDYDEQVVKLTGLPRYDNLVDCSDKQILIMPTWRKNLVSDIDPNNGTRKYNPSFKESTYCKTYNSLINNEKLLEAARKQGYKIIFFPHPAMWQQIQDFNKNENVIFADYNTSYQKLFNESSLIITDYSSVAFDFAYMKKPVLYYQFDRAEFFEGHTYNEGYFDYETMGFGEVVANEEELVSTMIDYMDNECTIKKMYEQRVDEFYKYTDQNNCKRVYEAIIDME